MYLLSFLSYLSFSFNLLPLAFALVPGSFHKDVTRPSHFRLKSRAIGNNNATISNLYVSSLHTEANDSDIVLRSFSDAFTASLKVTPNGTLLQFDRPTGFPWWMKIKGGSDGAAWGPVIIDAVVTNATTPDTPGFSFGGSGLQVDPSQFPGFKGWLACDGKRNVSHLFWRKLDNTKHSPSGCEFVEVIKEELPVNEQIRLGAAYSGGKSQYG